MRVSLQKMTECFHYDEYRRYWTGSNLAMLAFSMHDVVLGWQILVVTDSAFLVGLVAFARGIPLLILSPITGIMADSLKRQWIMAIGMGFASLASIGLALLIHSGLAGAWHIVLTSFLIGSAFTLYAPARLALLPNLVPGGIFLNASTVEYSSTRISGFVGPILAGALLGFAGPGRTLELQAGLYVAAALVFLLTGAKVATPHISGGQHVDVREALKEAVAYLRKDKALFAMALLGMAIVPIGLTYQKLMPVFAREQVGVGAPLLGLMIGLSSLGTALAGFGLASVGDSFQKSRVLLVTAAIFGAGLVVLSFTKQIAVVLVLLFLLGVVGGIYLTLTNVLFQSRPPDALRGRVMSAWSMVWGLLPFTSLLAGAVAEKWNVGLAIGVAGAICSLFVVGMAMTKSHLTDL